MAKVDLEFLAHQLDRVITDIASLKDDLTVVMAGIDRVDATARSLMVEVRAMHGRHERLAKRVEQLERTDR